MTKRSSFQDVLSSLFSHENFSTKYVVSPYMDRYSVRGVTINVKETGDTLSIKAFTDSDTVTAVRSSDPQSAAILLFNRISNYTN